MSAPLKLYGISNLVTAAIVYTLRLLPYHSCRYDGFIDQYQFLFRDEQERGAAIVASLNAKRQDLVPAYDFRRALFRLHEDFRKAQRANGNRNGGAL